MELLDQKSRYMLHPIQHKEIFEFFEKQVRSFWTVQEINFSEDRKDWETLTEDEQNYILNVLSFFAVSDGAVLENLMNQFIQEFQATECVMFFSAQAFIESIHQHAYSLMLTEFAPEGSTLLKPMSHHPAVKAKVDWAKSYFSIDEPDRLKNLAIRIIAFCTVEGVMFSSSFAALFWLRNRGLCHSMTMANSFIARDEGLHRDFGIMLYKKYFEKLPDVLVHKIVSDAVNIELTWVESVIPRLTGLNKDNLSKWVKFTADDLLSELGHTKLYNVKIPEEMRFMESISLEGKNNFFERRVSEYSTVLNDGFSTTEDF